MPNQRRGKRVHWDKQAGMTGTEVGGREGETDMGSKLLRAWKVGEHLQKAEFKEKALKLKCELECRGRTGSGRATGVGLRGKAKGAETETRREWSCSRARAVKQVETEAGWKRQGRRI